MKPNRKKNLYTRPDIAWPTISLFFISIFISSLSILLGEGWLIPLKAFHYVGGSWVYWVLSTILGIFCILLSTLTSYSQFTVCHDAIHRAISKKYKFLNDVVGRISQFWLGPSSSWGAIRYNHLEHHAHTNDSKLDPDYWCSLKGPGGKYLTPLRWMFVDVSYFHMYFLRGLKHKSIQDQTLAYSYELVKLAGLAFAWQWGWMHFLLRYWIIPSRLALFALAYAFDFLPHYPHNVTRENNRYKTTAYLYIPWILRPILSSLTFYQNYHIAHHLVSQVPFYEYKKVWEDMKGELLDEGVIIRDILPKLIEEKIVNILGDDEYQQLNKSKVDIKNE